MKTYSKAVFTAQDIDSFVMENKIEDGVRLLIQFFSGTTDVAVIEQFQAYFQLNFPKAALIGATSDGIIDGANVYAQKECLVVFSAFEQTHLKSLLFSHDDTYQDFFESGRKVASALFTHDTKVLITFADGIYTNGEEYIKGISSFDKKIVVAGGMAGDNGAIEKTYVFDKENMTSNGVVAVALNSENLEVVSDYSFDWIPIGKKLKVTKSVKNRVYEIDGISAVEMYSKYLGEELAQHLPQIGIEYPLILMKEGVSTGRAVLYKHDDGSLTFAGNIEEGEIVRFGLGNAEVILRSGNYHLRSILEKSMHQPETFFIYSCMARRRFIGHYIEKEIQPYAKTAPTAGFFTYGEFYHNSGKNQLLNETMTVLVLSESKKETQKFTENSLVQENYYSINPLHIMSHLTNVVSKELEDLNNHLETRIEDSTEYITKQAYYDELTKLPNRLKLLQDLPSYVGKMLFLLNIDDFTLVNDFYGHIIGDFVLASIPIILEECISRENVFIYRLPSDEFVLILDGVHDQLILEERIKTIQTKIKHAKINYNNYNINIDVTIAAAIIGKNGTGLSNADMALKVAKRANKSFLIFDDSLMLVKHYEENLSMASSLRKAIQSDKIISHFQPIYNIKTGKIEKYECLVRLVKDDGEVLNPYSFLEIAQKIKLYPQITKIMVEKTFSLFKENGLDFTINLSFEDMLNKETSDFIFEKITEHGIAQQLTVEILETQQMENEYFVQEFIGKVYSCGAKIAIDDFGSGFANFEHMTKIRADYIKIDGSLIKNIDKDKNARLVVETIIIFAQKLGMKTVAEFVHSKEIYDIVRELNIDFAQGYYLDKPLENIRVC
jgi:diguanylate cyclase (GGDEF)-like protein